MTINYPSKVICLVGTPGAGKTFFANELINTTCKNYLLFDDIKNQDKDLLIEALKNNKNCIITDPHFCITKTRDNAQKIIEQFTKNIKWIYFENNPEQCLINVINRNDGRKVEELIKQYSKFYMIPSYSDTKKVYKK